MELDRTGSQFKLTTFSRSLEASQSKTRLKTLRLSTAGSGISHKSRS
jgi:hypothetical protein